MEEQRKFFREKSQLRGCVYFDNRNATVDCFVRDISVRGARLTFVSDVTIPDEIELHIPQRNQTFRADVLWRRGNEMGLVFAASLNSPLRSDFSGLDERVRKLEQEADQLRQTISRLKGGTRPNGFEAA
jgi:PilZ domain